MRVSRTLSPLVLAGVLWSASITAQSPKSSAPETLSANAQATNSNVGLSAVVGIHIERYTPDRDREAMADALRYGGYPGFLTALRKAPDVGYVELGGKKFVVRWAREQPAGQGRTIVVVTDQPVFFVGGGSVTEKPRAGYELAVLRLDVDAVGLGTGTMAAAARVKAGGPTGVQVDDYGSEPLKLVTVRKSFK